MLFVSKTAETQINMTVLLFDLKLLVNWVV